MSIKAFETRAAEAKASGRRRLVPVWRDTWLDLDTPVSAFAKVRRGPFAYLLESAPAGGERWARYTFLGSMPRAAWRLVGDSVQEWTSGRGWHARRHPADPLADLDALLVDAEPLDVPELGEFWSGAIGFLSYDVGRLGGQASHAPIRKLDVPDAFFVFTDAMVILDNLRLQASVVVGVPVDPQTSQTEIAARYATATNTIDETILRLQGPPVMEPIDLDLSAVPTVGRSSYHHNDYLTGVERIRKHISAGLVSQVRLSRRVEIPLDFRPDFLYRALRDKSPSPCMFHLVFDGLELVGSSPELLVRLERGTITQRPIAGSRRRGLTKHEDAATVTDLATDDEARHKQMMAISSCFNDVSAVAEPQTARLSKLMAAERHVDAIRLVSQVDAELIAGCTAMDALRAVFPPTTMTGTPRAEAMKVIDELEPERRGPYGGVVGFIAMGSKRMEMAITVRTCVIANGVASIQAGAAVVSSSKADRVWDETESKAQVLLAAIGSVKKASQVRPGA